MIQRSCRCLIGFLFSHLTFSHHFRHTVGDCVLMVPEASYTALCVAVSPRRFPTTDRVSVVIRSFPLASALPVHNCLASSDSVRSSLQRPDAISSFPCANASGVASTARILFDCPGGGYWMSHSIVSPSSANFGHSSNIFRLPASPRKFGKLGFYMFCRSKREACKSPKNLGVFIIAEFWEV